MTENNNIQPIATSFPSTDTFEDINKFDEFLTSYEYADDIYKKNKNKNQLEQVHFELKDNKVIVSHNKNKNNENKDINEYENIQIIKAKDNNNPNTGKDRYSHNTSTVTDINTMSIIKEAKDNPEDGIDINSFSYDANTDDRYLNSDFPNINKRLKYL